MDKVFPIIISVLAVSVFVYALPDFLAFFGFNASPSVKPVIYVYDGNSFSPSYFESSGLPDVYDIASNPVSNLLYAGTSKGLFISKDKGKKWYSFADLEKILAKARIYQIKISPINPRKIYVSLFKNGKGGLYVTKDNFFTLTKVFDLGKEAVYKIEPDKNSLILGVSDGRLIRYNLAKNTFSLINSFPASVKDIALFRNNLYVATKDGGLWEKKGEQWERISVYGTVDLLSNSREVYAASVYGVYRYLRNQWQKIPSVAKFATHIFSGPQGGIYLCSKNKLYRMSNSGKDWQIIDSFKRKITALNYYQNHLIIGTGDD